MKKSETLILVGSLLVIVSLGSAIIVGLTFVPWDLVIKYPREAILIADGPLLIAGIICGCIGVDLDEKGK